ncbi:MAG: HAD-IA family hydrolase [Chloroflexi bacterium]|nr:HAD-IA family hydrolase [Chloroflexota bacterium]
MVRAVIFDLFNTLVYGALNPLWNNLAQKTGLEVAVFQEKWRQSRETAQMELKPLAARFEALFRELGVGWSPAIAEEVSDMRMAAVRQVLVTPREKVLETIRMLRSADIGTGVISNASAEVSLFWPESPLSTLIDAAVFSGNVGLSKPDPRIYRHICDVLGVEPESCVYVGDGGDGELTGAKSVGMLPVQILVRSSPDTEAAHYIGTLEELLPILGLPRSSGETIVDQRAE